MSATAPLAIASLLAILVFARGRNRDGRLAVGGALLILAPVAWLVGDAVVHAFADNQPGSLTRGEWVMVLRSAQLFLWVAPFAVGLVLMRRARGSGRPRAA